MYHVIGQLLLVYKFGEMNFVRETMTDGYLVLYPSARFKSHKRVVTCYSDLIILLNWWKLFYELIKEVKCNPYFT